MPDFLYQENEHLPNYEWSRILGQTTADYDFKALEDALDCLRDFYGVGIIYYDGYHSYLVRPSRRVSTSGQSEVTHVIVTRLVGIYPESISKNVKAAVADPSLKTEITSTFLSCGALILTGVATVTATVAAPITGGASTPLVVLAAAGTAATAMQCANGLWRIYDIEENDGKSVSWVETQGWYTATSTALDLVSLASAGGALKEALMTYRVMKSASSMKVIEWLKNYSRPERVRLTEGDYKILKPWYFK